MKHGLNSEAIRLKKETLDPTVPGDIENGTLTESEAQELLDCLWIKFSEP